MQGKGKNEVISYEGVHCANCSAPMQGEFCHECGQSIHTALRPMHHMLEDTMETFLHVDGRVLHTLPPLLTKPGFLTLEYFSGRRQRYIPPFRLMFVLCLLAFFLTHIAIDALSEHEGGTPALNVAHMNDKNPFEGADTPAEVREALDEQLAQLHEARAKTGGIPGVDTGLIAAETALRTKAAERIAELAPSAAPAGSTTAAAASTASATTPASAASAAPVPDSEARRERKASKDKFKSWLQGHDRVEIAWLPGFMNARLNHAADNLRDNLRDLNSHDTEVRTRALERIKAGIFGALPQTMFFMMPVFALLLKLFYLFKRRLYMEHLIVALHSHAFLFAILLLWVALALLKAWIAPHAAWAAQGLGWVETALALWAPAYLLLMQKRIYRQGWVMTVLKYLVIGWCYLWLLTTALIWAAALGISH